MPEQAFGNSLGGTMRLAGPSVLALAVAVGCAYGSGGERQVQSVNTSPPAQPETLVAVRGAGGDVGPVYGFAQDGEVLVWVADDKRTECPPVRMRDDSSGRSAVVGRGEHGAQSAELCFEYGFWIAAAGIRALWAGWVPANSPWGDITTGGFGRRPREVGGLSSDYSEAGDVVVDLVGDGEILAYATLFVVPNDSDACFPEDSPRKQTCRFRVRRGAVKRVEGNRAVVIPEVPPSVAIAASVGRLAVVPADLRWGRELHARVNAPVEIRDARSGRLETRVQPTGEVEAVALSELVVAVLVRQGRRLRLEVYDVRTGARQSSVSVGGKAGPELVAAGTTVVYGDKKAIRLHRAGERATSLLATAATEYWFDLSIEGGRVAWVENRKDGRQGVIRAIQLGES
jgi:hypothetical protein